MPSPRGRARPRILDAGVALMSEGGLEAVTLEAVASRAGLSRSGLHYHFATKERLMNAMAEAIVARLASACSAEAAMLPDRPDRDLQAYVVTSIFDRAGNDRMTSKAIASGPIPAAAIAPFRRYWAGRFPPFADAVGFDLAALVHVATEGLWFMEVLGLSPFTSEQRGRLVDMILALAEGRAAVPRAEDGKRWR